MGIYIGLSGGLPIHLIGIFVDEHGNPEAEENFEEAIRAVTSSIKSCFTISFARLVTSHFLND